RFFGIGVSMWIPCRARSFPKMPFRTHHEDDSMRTELYWIEGPWRGRLAIMPRPRGGDWLEDEIQSWRRSGVDVVVSLLTCEERTELNLRDEESLCRANSIEFISFPIVDRSIPSSAEAFSEQVITLAEPLELLRANNVRPDLDDDISARTIIEGAKGATGSAGRV